MMTVYILKVIDSELEESEYREEENFNNLESKSENELYILEEVLSIFWKNEFSKGYKDSNDYYCKNCVGNNVVNRAGSELISIYVAILYNNSKLNTKAMIDTGANKCDYMKV